MATPPSNTSQPTSAPTDPAFTVYAGIPHDESIENPAWAIEPDTTVAGGVVRGVLEDGTPFIGSLDAPIVFAEFSDFSCPHCATFEPEIHQLIETYVRTGQLRLEFRPLTFVARDYSQMAARDALCAAQQGAFWEFHTTLFAIQHTQGAQDLTEPTMLEIAKNLGLVGSAFQDCLNSERPDLTLQVATQLQTEMGINATPTLIYRGNDVLQWQRFYDGNGNTVTRLLFEQMGEIISNYGDN